MRQLDGAALDVRCTPQARDAARVLGLQIAQGRRERRWTAGELAARANISPVTLRKVERGDPTVALGTALEVATLVGIPLFGVDPSELARVATLLHGSSIGGARPKATLSDDGRNLIAKFCSTTDTYPVVKAEAIAMNLARRAGVNVASTELRQVHGKDVLLVERFDRTDVPGQRRMFVSALTILQLPEIAGRYATYYDLADIIRSRFTDRASTLRELFARITFNVCVGNTDDHARNHAAFWDGEQLTLTPAFDICPKHAPEVKPLRQWRSRATGSGSANSLAASTRPKSTSFRPLRPARSSIIRSTFYGTTGTRQPMKRG